MGTREIVMAAAGQTPAIPVVGSTWTYQAGLASTAWGGTT